ncbi:MAG: hypothetical protein JWR26_1701 [Pedosphaera sp.]|nr:hypothetical protein [Pedosphaera sp.]
MSEAQKGARGRIWGRKILRSILGLALFWAGIALIPHRWCSREARALFDGDEIAQEKLVHGMETWISTSLKQDTFTSGFEQINGEWLFGSYMMAGMGFGQTALEHPKWKARHIELMAVCIEKLLSREARSFDLKSWKRDPIDSLETTDQHGSYLGYLNLLLSFHRLLDPASKYSKLNDQITAALVERIEKSPGLLLQSYPDQVYPVDNCAVIGSIGLYDRATGKSHGDLIERWIAKCRENYIHPQTGLFYQAVDYSTGSALDNPRGSGTCFGIYFLSFADRAFAKSLFDSVKVQLADTLFGFGVVREYPKSIRSGGASVDSGPIVFGYGMSPTAFSIGCSRLFGDAKFYGQLYGTAYLVGAPLDRKDRKNFIMGGSIGDAILFAMLTAQRGMGQTGRVVP